MKFNPYRLLPYRNDFKAALSGRLPQRLVRKQIWRQTGHLARFVSRLLGVAR